jgi:CyaY protein
MLGSMALDEATFDRLADDALHRLETRVSAADEDLEVSLSQGVLTIQFVDKTRYVINSHRAARQIWMAANARAWHFDWDGRAWISTKSKEDLWAVVDAAVSERLGRPAGVRAD